MVEQQTLQFVDGGSNPTSPLHLFYVSNIQPWETHSWLLKKHYAKRIPAIQYCMGLYSSGKELVGVCTFGPPCRAYNMGEFVFCGYKVETVELNRLVVEDGLPKNSLSFFVSKAIWMLPKPCCVVSYADHNKGHHGYIYQATNFIYTGLNEIHDTEYIIDGKEVHSRTLTGKGITAPKEWAREHGIETTEIGRKHRYFMFIGNKMQRREMDKHFRFKKLPYPKGDNKRYDSSSKVEKQGILF